VRRFNEKHMNFGTIAVSAGGGTVVLSTSGAELVQEVTLPSFTGIGAAQFAVSGQANYTYYIYL
jgi:hypothetical protein